MFWQIVSGVLAGLLLVFVGLVWGVAISAKVHMYEEREHKLEIETLKLQILHLQNEIYIAENDKELK